MSKTVNILIQGDIKCRSEEKGNAQYKIGSKRTGFMLFCALSAAKGMVYKYE